MYKRMFLIVTLSLATTAWAQTSPAANPTEQVKALLERVQQLEKRVAQLEGKQGDALTASTWAPQAMVPQESRPQQTLAGPEHLHQTEPLANQTVAEQMEPHYPSLQIRGFADVDFSATDQKGSFSGFNLGQFDLHFASALSKKISYFGEVTFNASPTGYGLELCGVRDGLTEH